MFNPLFGNRIPVSEIRASQEWLDRVEENPANYMTPEKRLILSIPRRLDPFQERGMASVTIGDRVFLLDERTPQEKEEDQASITLLQETIEDASNLQNCKRTNYTPKSLSADFFSFDELSKWKDGG